MHGAHCTHVRTSSSSGLSFSRRERWSKQSRKTSEREREDMGQCRGSTGAMQRHGGSVGSVFARWRASSYQMNWTSIAQSPVTSTHQFVTVWPPPHKSPTHCDAERASHGVSLRRFRKEGPDTSAYCVSRDSTWQALLSADKIIVGASVSTRSSLWPRPSSGQLGS